MRTRFFSLLCIISLITLCAAHETHPVLGMKSNSTNPVLQRMNNLAYCQKYLRQQEHYHDPAHHAMRELCSLVMYQDTDWTKRKSIAEADQLFEHRIALFYCGALWLLVVYLYLTF